MTQRFLINYCFMFRLIAFLFFFYFIEKYCTIITTKIKLLTYSESNNNVHKIHLLLATATYRFNFHSWIDMNYDTVSFDFTFA